MRCQRKAAILLVVTVVRLPAAIRDVRTALAGKGELEGDTPGDAARLAIVRQAPGCHCNPRQASSMLLATVNMRTNGGTVATMYGVTRHAFLFLPLFDIIPLCGKIL